MYITYFSYTIYSLYLWHTIAHQSCSIEKDSDILSDGFQAFKCMQADVTPNYIVTLNSPQLVFISLNRDVNYCAFIHGSVQSVRLKLIYM